MASFEEDMRVYTYLSTIFAGLLVIANVLAVKPAVVAGAVVPAAVVTYALTFTVTDVVNELWGPKRSTQLVWSGFIVSLLVAGLIRIALWLPSAGDWDGDSAFQEVLGLNGRIVIASMVAYLASQFHDVWAFHFWRRLTKGRHLWLRNNASTIVSQLLDSAIFITVAFYGVWGGFDVIIPAIGSQFLVKMVIALIDTPFVYGVVALCRRLMGGSPLNERTEEAFESG